MAMYLTLSLTIPGRSNVVVIVQLQRGAKVSISDFIAFVPTGLAQVLAADE